MKRLPSCKTYRNKMKNGHDNNKCNKYLNWDITRAKYTKELVDSINGYTIKPYQITLEL